MLRNRCRILLVDDDADTLYVLRTFLELECFDRVLTAETGPQALKLAQEFKPHIVLLDVMMPGNYDLAMLRSLRSELGAGCKIWALTGRADLDLKQSGFDEHLIKPIEPQVLIDLLKPVCSSVSMLMQSVGRSLECSSRLQGELDRRHTRGKWRGIERRY
jgi:CheY-like chemotaxis protein